LAPGNLSNQHWRQSRGMERSALESLSTDLLRQLIVDASDVLAERARGSTAVAAAERSPASSAISSGLFTFGLTSNNSTPAASAPPAFTGFSASTGGGLFGGLFAGGGYPATSSTPAAKNSGEAKRPEAQAAGDEEEREDDNGLVEEEEVTAVYGWTPSITLEVCDSIATGEESEEQLYCQRSKLYRFKDGEWKERGLGEAKLLKNKESGRVRFLLRQEKTGKVVSNHYLIDKKPYCQLQLNADSEKIWVWCAQDFSDGELAVEQLALKFGTVELAKQFQEAFEKAKSENAKVLENDEQDKKPIS